MIHEICTCCKRYLEDGNTDTCKQQGHTHAAPNMPAGSHVLSEGNTGINHGQPWTCASCGTAMRADDTCWWAGPLPYSDVPVTEMLARGDDVFILHRDGRIEGRSGGLPPQIGLIFGDQL